MATAALRPRPAAPPLPHPPGGSSSDRRRSASLAVRAGRLQRAMAASAGRSLPLLLCRHRGAAATLSAAGCFPALGRRRQQQRHRTVSEAGAPAAGPCPSGGGRGGCGARRRRELSVRPPARSWARGGLRRRRQLRVILSAAKLERGGGPPRADPGPVNFPRHEGGWWGGAAAERSGAGPGRAGALRPCRANGGGGGRQVARGQPTGSRPARASPRASHCAAAGVRRGSGSGGLQGVAAVRGLQGGGSRLAWRCCAAAEMWR